MFYTETGACNDLKTKRKMGGNTVVLLTQRAGQTQEVLKLALVLAQTNKPMSR